MLIKGNVIHQLIQAAELGGSDLFQLISNIKFVEYFSKGFFIAQILRNRNLQRFLHGLSYTKAGAVQDNHDDAENNGEQDRVTVSADAAGEA
ncbi:hypothetical protein D3C80_1815500 [compost metagenome]